MTAERLNVGQYYVYYPIALVILAIGIWAVHQANKGRSFLGFLVGASGLVVLVLKTISIYPPLTDYEIYLRAGLRVLAGQDPYIDRLMVSPPTALPLFALFATLPHAVGSVIWIVVNLMAAVLLVPLAQATLIAQDEANRVDLPGPALIVLAVVFFLNISVHFAVNLGQLSVFVTFCVLAALVSQGRGWAILAGVFLAFAACKPHTLLSFLILFLSGRDLRAWMAFVLVSVLLGLGCGPILELPARLRSEMANISDLSPVGAANDFSFEGPFDHMIIGIDRLLYCLGLRDRTAISMGQVAVLVVVGGWLIGLALRPRGFPRGAICALVALYSMIFFYHRNYDAPILALPLVYAASQTRVGQPVERRWNLIALVAMLVVLYVHPKLVEVVVERATAGRRGLEYLGQAVLLPYATWLIMLSMTCLALGAYQVRHQYDRRPIPAESDPVPLGKDPDLWARGDDS